MRMCCLLQEMFIKWIQMVLSKPALSALIWVFPKIEVPQNGWFIMDNPIKMGDLGVPPFKETPIKPC